MEAKKKSWTSALFAYAEGEKSRLLLSVVLSVLSVMLGLVPFYCMYRLICLMAAGTATAALAVKWCLLALASLVTFPLSFLCMGLTFKITGKEKDEVLHGVDLTLPEGSFTALVGPSGGGKSTVAKLIARFWDVTSGAITIGGVNVKDMPLSQQAISALTRGKTIITIAHRLATVQNADQILVVDDGRIAQHGTHDQLVKQEGLYRRFTAIRQQAEGWRIAAE